MYIIVVHNILKKWERIMPKQQKSIQEGKLLYHLTPLENIELILKDGLKSRAQLEDGFKDIAEPDIIKFRKENGITKGIPFHFFHGTPFAGQVQKTHNHLEFVYITIHRDTAKNNDFKIFPTHPKHMAKPKAYDYKEGMKIIDWKLMDLRDYSITECKEVCMAECIAPYKYIKSGAFHSIIVKSDETKKYLEELCQKLYNKKCTIKFFIDVNPYYFVR